MSTRRLAVLILPLMLASCTQAELSNILPQPTPPQAAKPAAMTFRLDNPGASTRPCTSMTAQLALTTLGGDLGGGLNVQSPDVQAGEAWSRTLTPDELAAASNVRLTVTCIRVTTDAGGNTVTEEGYSVTDHVPGQTVQSVTAYGPREAQNLAARVEWKTPVPTVLPLDQ